VIRVQHRGYRSRPQENESSHAPPSLDQTLPHDHDPVMTLSAILQPAMEGGYTAFNPETGTTTQGETVDEALNNLREATELYLEEFPAPVRGSALMTSFEVPAHA
jgi:predicted RNase H-like HicB family nuclease